MRWFFKRLILAALLLVLLAGIILLDTSPLVTHRSSQQVEYADQVSTLLDDMRTVSRARYRMQDIVVSAKQANSLVGFVQRALGNVHGQLSLEAAQATLDITVDLPPYLLNSYLNVRTKVVDAPGVNIVSVQIGSLSFSGNWLLGVAEWLTNAYTKTQVATIAINTVQWVKIDPQQVFVSIKPLDPLLREIKNIETGGSSNKKQLLIIKTAHYLRFLDSLYIPPAHGDQQAPSLAHYLQALMKEASALSNYENGSATLENEAALLALAIYAGNKGFAPFVGDLSFAIKPIPTTRNKPALANRKDLSLHFVFSAAIKLLSEQGISIAVGEFKELMDRRQGGSGYSFVDLAADMAGANLAALAVHPSYAEHVQAILSKSPVEANFFPSIQDLEEGMDKAEFKRKYDVVDSPAYVSIVTLIEQRLSTLAVSQLSKEDEQ